MASRSKGNDVECVPGGGYDIAGYPPPFCCEKETDFSVELIIPVYRPGGELAELLSRMRRQTVRPGCIHLLVTGEKEDFEKIRERFEKCAGDLRLRFTRIPPEEFDHGGTRHLGAEESRADVLLFMTQDAVPADEFLVENLLKPLCEGAAAAYARQLPRHDCSPVERFSRHFNYPEEGCLKTKADLSSLGIKTCFCSNVCAAYKRSVYEALGGFERHTIFNEDMIFASKIIKAGGTIAYAADARVIHSHNYTGAEQLHRNFDLAVSQADHPEVFGGLPSEGEGIRMVKANAAHLCRSGRAYLVPKLIWQSGCKYLGYLLGKHYRLLPRRAVLALTMNRRYWEQGEGKTTKRNRAR